MPPYSGRNTCTILSKKIVRRSGANKRWRISNVIYLLSNCSEKRVWVMCGILDWGKMDDLLGLLNAKTCLVCTPNIVLFWSLIGLVFVLVTEYCLLSRVCGHTIWTRQLTELSCGLYHWFISVPIRCQISESGAYRGDKRQVNWNVTPRQSTCLMSPHPPSI